MQRRHERSYKIGITGSNNTGKSTLASALHVRLKTRNLAVEVAQESTRECPLGIKEQTTVESTIWIFARQAQIEVNAQEHDEIVIADKTAIDTLAYGKWTFNNLDNPTENNQRLLTWLENSACEWAKTFDYLFYLPISDDIPFNFWQEGVDHRSDIDELIREILHEENLPFITVLPVPVEARVDYIVNFMERTGTIPLI